MQQMASLLFVLTIFAGYEQVFCVRGGITRNVVGDIHEKFIPAVVRAVQGHLFRQCEDEAIAIEGSLYSINVADGISYHRAVLEADQDVTWTDTGLKADQGVVQCAFKALEVGAQMYKYDGLCWVHQGVSQDPQTTDCGTGDVVYIRTIVPCSDGSFQCLDGTCIDGAKKCDDVKDCPSGNDERRCYQIVGGCFLDDFQCVSEHCIEGHRRCDGVYDCPDYSDESGCGLGCTPAEFECNDGVCVADTVTCDGTDDCAGGEDELVCDFNIFQGERIPYGEFSGCFYSSPNGMTFGKTSTRLVEGNLPSEVTMCCPHVENGVCIYVDDIETQEINFCEASARCEALGFAMLSSDLQEQLVKDYVLSLVASSKLPETFPINYVRDEQGVWKWMPSGTTETPFTFIQDPTIDQNCTLLDFSTVEPVLVAVNCHDAVGHNSLCSQQSTQLSSCDS